MTTTVKRGAGRPAAAAKRTKAAQQPTEAAQTTTQEMADAMSPNNAAARARRAGKATGDPDSMSLGELRQFALGQGWSSATKLNRVSLLKVLREHPDGPPKAQANGASKPAKVRTFRPITPGLRGDGAAKTAHVGNLLKGLGWRVEIDGTRLTAQRAGQTLVLVHTDKGRFDANASGFTPNPDALQQRVINVATAMRIAQREVKS